MALEASDLNDGSILQSTRQTAGPNDTVKFSITLPSGREFSSEFFQNDRKREALHSWLQVVRQQVVAESEAAEEEVKRLWFEEQARKKRDMPPLIIPPPEEKERLIEAPSAVEAPVSSEPIGSMDALSHAKRMVASALQSKGLAQSAYVKASEALGEAEKNLRRWTQIMAVLESSDEFES